MYLPYLTWPITCDNGTGLHDRNFLRLPPTLLPFQKQSPEWELSFKKNMLNLRGPYTPDKDCSIYIRTIQCHHMKDYPRDPPRIYELLFLFKRHNC